jgi:hypothetical protein
MAAASAIKDPLVGVARSEELSHMIAVRAKGDTVVEVVYQSTPRVASIQDQ